MSTLFVHSMRCGLLVVVCGMTASYATAQAPVEPTEAHQVLKQDVGKWKCTMKMWPAGPDGQVIESTGTEVNEMVLNGLWLNSKFSGSMMGTEFTGRGQFGYDPIKEKYVGTWIDSTSPHLSVMEGTYDRKAKTLTMMGSMIDLESGAPVEVKNVTSYSSEDTRVMTMYGRVIGESAIAADGEGAFSKMMEIRYTRAE